MIKYDNFTKYKWKRSSKFKPVAIRVEQAEFPNQWYPPKGLQHFWEYFIGRKYNN